MDQFSSGEDYKKFTDTSGTKRNRQICSCDVGCWTPSVQHPTLLSRNF